MSGKKDAALRFGTLVLTLVMAASLFATMTMLGCTKEDQQPDINPERLQEEGISQGAVQEPQLSDAQRDVDDKVPVKVQEKESAIDNSAAANKTESGNKVNWQQAPVYVYKEPEISGNNSGSTSTPPQLPLTCPGCKEVIAKQEEPHMPCKYCNVYRCVYTDGTEHEYLPCNHFYCINGQHAKYDGGHLCPYGCSGCYSEGSHGTCTFCGLCIGDGAEHGKCPDCEKCKAEYHTHAPAAVIQQASLSVAQAVLCGKCGDDFSLNTHITLFCGHELCPIGDNVHAQLPCLAHYRCGETYPDAQDHFTPCAFCGQYTCTGAPHGEGICNP